MSFSVEKMKATSLVLTISFVLQLNGCLSENTEGETTNWLFQIRTVQRTSVQTKLVLCTKGLIFKMLFYYLEMPASSSPKHPFSQLTGTSKWGTVWTSISTGIETTYGQSFYQVNIKVLAMTMCSFYASWDKSSYATSF